MSDVCSDVCSCSFTLALVHTSLFANRSGHISQNIVPCIEGFEFRSVPPELRRLLQLCLWV